MESLEQDMDYVVCTECGYENDVEDKYCNRCDKVIGKFEDK